jgi:hypothetical protein
VKTATRKSDPALDYAISGMAHAVGGPIIVHNVGWGKTLPDWIRKDLSLNRLTQQMLIRAGKEKPGMATDLEVTAFLYTASLEAPLTHEWTNIYLWVACQAMKAAGKPTTGVTPPESLSTDERRLLDDFRRWLWNRYETLIREGAKRLRADRLAEEPYTQCNFWKEKEDADDPE